MRSNLDNNIIRSARLLSASHGIIRFNLTGTFVIPPDGPTMHFLDPGAVDRTVFLPAITPQAGQEYFVANLSSTKVLNIVDSDGVAVVSIPALGTVIFISYALGWRYIFDGSGALLNTQVVVTTATYTILPVDDEVLVNRAGTVTLTLPDLTLWWALHPTRTLLIKDVSGAGFTNNITINPVGGTTIDGNASVDITSDYGGFRLRPLTSTLWGIV